MTTTNAATPPVADPAAIPDDADHQYLAQQGQKPDAIRRFAFPVYLACVAAFVGVGGQFIVSGPAVNDGFYRVDYPVVSVWLFIVLNALLMWFPVYKAFRMLGSTENRTRAAMYLVVVAVSFVVLFICLAIATVPNLSFLVDYGKRLFNLYAIPGVLGIVAQTLAALFMSRGYKESSEQIREDLLMLPRRVQAAADAKIAFETAETDRNTCNSTFEALRTAHEPFTTAVLESAAAFKEAEKAYQETEAYKEQATVKNSIAAAMQRRQEIIGEIQTIKAESATKRGQVMKELEELQIRIDKTRDGSAQRDELEEERDTLDAQLAGLRQAAQPLEEESTRLQVTSGELDARLAELTTELDASDEKAAMDAAKAASDAAVEAEAEDRKDLDAAEKALKAAETEFGNKSTAQTEAEKSRDETQGRINEAESASRLRWKDSPALPVGLLFIALAFGPDWLGFAWSAVS